MEKIKKNIGPILLGVLIIALIIGSVLYFNQKRLNRKDYNNNASVNLETDNKELDKIDPDDSNNANNKVTVYVFHASYCPYCKNSLAFLKDIVNDYEYLEVKTYQTDDQEHPDHIKLYQATSDYFKDNIDTIPYIIIGDIYKDTGFGEATKDLIKKAIEKAHTSTKYKDVVAEVIKDNPDLNIKAEIIKKN